jgi:hypothetical protein
MAARFFFYKINTLTAIGVGGQVFFLKKTQRAVNRAWQPGIFLKAACRQLVATYSDSIFYFSIFSSSSKIEKMYLYAPPYLPLLPLLAVFLLTLSLSLLQVHMGKKSLGGGWALQRRRGCGRVHLQKG